jgi:hypothetical protein
MEMTMKATLLSDTRFAMRMVILILVTHAVGYLTHEYAHTTMAWMLGADGCRHVLALVDVRG